MGLFGYIVARDAVRGLSRAAWPSTPSSRRPSRRPYSTNVVIVPTRLEPPVARTSEERYAEQAFKPSRTETINARDQKQGMDLDELWYAIRGAFPHRDTAGREANLRTALGDIAELIQREDDQLDVPALRRTVAAGLQQDNRDRSATEGPVDGRTPRLRAKVTIGGRLRSLTIERP